MKRRFAIALIAVVDADNLAQADRIAVEMTGDLGSRAEVVEVIEIGEVDVPAVVGASPAGPVPQVPVPAGPEDRCF